MRNDRHADKKRKRDESSVSNDENINNNGFYDNVVEETERQKHDIEFLKITIVNDTNLAIIKEKLKSTMSYRLEMMKTLELDVLETFPYFFTHPSLVKCDIT